MTAANTASHWPISYLKYPQSPQMKGRIAFALEPDDYAWESPAAEEKPVLHCPPVPKLFMHGHLIPLLSAEETGGHFSHLRAETSCSVQQRSRSRENQGKIWPIFLVFSKLTFKRRQHEGKIRETIEASPQTVTRSMTETEIIKK